MASVPTNISLVYLCPMDGCRADAVTCGAAIVTFCESPSGSTLMISPTPSIWPVTIWPPISSPMRRDRSRLTGVPSAQPPKVVPKGPNYYEASLSLIRTAAVA